MTIPLLVREMLPEERSMVLSDWKKDLRDAAPEWGRALRADEWWALVNHVVDNVTFPSSTVWMGCHRNEPSVPLCWVAARGPELLHLYARVSVREEPELAAYLERALVEHTKAKPTDFNPFLELRRPQAQR